MKIGIIGGNGRYGTWFQTFFGEHYPDCQVITSDPKTPTSLSNTALAEQADVILISVPVTETATVVRTISSLITGKLVIEIASTDKEKICDALLKTGAEFLQIHPMCNPPNGKTNFGAFAMHVSPREWRVWREWIQRFLEKAKGNQIHFSSPAEMDLYAGAVQNPIHAIAMAIPLLHKALGLEQETAQKAATGPYEITTLVSHRILKQEWDLYWNVFQNPNAIRILGLTEDIIREIRRSLEQGDEKAFQRMFAEGGEYMGKENLRKGYDRFTDLLQLLHIIAEEEGLDTLVKLLKLSLNITERNRD
ncbi:MAG: prephenate dehydrogenase/arogenate dehydrogenase family protein [Nanoarchaeota archaeon]|nr:prephenate dehydrogenase/arogenate dehydrogenase family protein [Nanoarchaeota archaeon]